MGSKKSQKPDLRGGRRENAGRKPTWNNKDTITIRVPKFIAAQVMELAHRLDCGEYIELNFFFSKIFNLLQLLKKL